MINVGNEKESWVQLSCLRERDNSYLVVAYYIVSIKEKLQDKRFVFPAWATADSSGYLNFCCFDVLHFTITVGLASPPNVWKSVNKSLENSFNKQIS